MEKFDLSPLFFEETKLPEILYHYTSVPSFVSLMDKDAYFYATHFAFLNDGLEIGYGQSIFDEYVRINYPDLDKEYGNSFRIREKGHYAWFVASFSEVSDDLSQWRAYTDKSEGGFAIGFNMEEIKKHISYDILKDSKIELSERIAAFFTEHKPINLLKCMYQTDQIHAFLKEHLDWINKTYKENKKRQDSGDKRIIQDALLGNLIDLRRLVGTFAKQDSFYQEKECRIVLWKDFTKEPLKTFANKPRLPVMKLEHKDMIASITVSPQGNQKRNQKLAEILCVKLGISPKIIKLSKSSFIGK